MRRCLHDMAVSLEQHVTTSSSIPSQAPDKRHLKSDGMPYIAQFAYDDVTTQHVYPGACLTSPQDGDIT